MRKNICVIAKMNEDGVISPLSFFWNGEQFAVQKVLERRKAASLKGGGTGIRFKCEINQKTHFMWLDGYTWFVEVD
ncbi:MAG: hypothetical protein IJ538_04360 [Clostridia bacterium]|nr:hypothetical protein [Clostridia bacterium]